MMAKKKTARQMEKYAASDKEVFGVHVIDNTDIENHFGSSENKTDTADAQKETELSGESKTESSAGKRGQTTAIRTKIDVRLQLDEQIRRQAKAAAAQKGLELSRYVENGVDPI